MWGAKTGPIFNKDSLVELKNFGLVKIFLKKFLAIIRAFHSDFKGVYKKQMVNDMWVQIALALGFGGAFALLIHGVYIGAIALGSLVFSFSAVSRFQYALNQLFDNFGRASEHRRNLNSFIDFYEMKPLVVSGTRIILPTDSIHVEFKNVSFAYPSSDRKVINNLSLSIKQGTDIAIVGLNGAGKTTFIKLLTRVYDPTEGDIFINNIPLREYDLKSWKECMGILLQEYSIYSEETVAENIMLGDVSKHDQELVVKNAMETTIHEVIEKLPHQYDQRVGTEFRGGVEFSKGQKQKLALARVLYRNAPFVILDEPTASIDAVSEDAIFKSLRNHNDQTRIIISHKFSNVREADKIILIEQGTIIEEGTHDELMKINNGRYRELFELQAEGYK
jgi:ATP-binding cassette subfamily B protein